MYFAYGWPKVFGLGSWDQQHAGHKQQFLSLHTSDQYVFGVTATAVHLWSGGLHRVHLSAVRPEEEQVNEEGRNVAAYYSAAKSVLVVVVSQTAPR